MNQEKNQNDEFFCHNIIDCATLGRKGKETEQALYERLRTLVERNPEREHVVFVQSANKEKEIKAIFRAAVYGNVSLLFGNIFTNEDANEAKESANRAFRALLEEGHEFNGFLPKGILIDTPLALLSGISEQGFDFFCLDAKKISFLLMGAELHHRDCIDEKMKKIVQKFLPKSIPLYKIDSDFHSIL